MIQNAETNKVTLIGRVVSPPVYLYSKFDDNFYSFKLSITRLSGMTDEIVVIASERQMAEYIQHEYLYICGELRTRNEIIDGKSKLSIYVFAKNIEDAEADDFQVDEVSLIGAICKKPVYRLTPFSREICDLVLAVNRKYHKSDYVPSITWGTAARIASELQVGTRLSVTGRLQSRKYVKVIDGEKINQTAYELSINKFEVLNESIQASE